MNELCQLVLKKMQGKTLVTAESCTGGMIGAALTAVSGSSLVYKGGIVSYTDEVKEKLLGVSRELLDIHGAVSEQAAAAMASGVRKTLNADVALSVTGLAGPGCDAFGNPVGLVYIGYSSKTLNMVKKCFFTGDRDSVREQATVTALQIVLENN